MKPSFPAAAGDRRLGDHLPALLTPACNWPEGFTAGAAIEVLPEPGSLAEGLRRLLGDRDADRRAMGEKGLALVRERFTWEQVAAQMRAVCGWMMGGGTPPSCVTVR
jgi:poly(glycerol-phosphate) alpha-glucosyltransferase